MNLQDIKERLNSKEKFERVRRRIRRNDIIAGFYDQLFDETGEETLPRIAKNLRDCCQYWDIDYYRLQGVKDILRTNCCKNRFCDNCQNALSIQREKKYAPFLDALRKSFDIYHIVFTIPNPYPEKLSIAVSNMFAQFKYIIRLFTGNAKIKGYDFSKYGFIGCVRALEITKNEKEGTFHPHFHSLFVLRKGLKLDENRYIINRFSFNNPDIKKSHHKRTPGKPERLFSDFEVLLQKIWRLRVDGTRVNCVSIEQLKEGYSVICDNAEGKYKEIFKYATKGIFKNEDENALQGYADFVPLYQTLYRRKIIQGYGLLNKFKFEEGIALDARQDQAYNEIVQTLKTIEDPVRVYEYLTDINANLDRKDITYISRSTIGELMGAEYGV